MRACCRFDSLTIIELRCPTAVLKGGKRGSDFPQAKLELTPSCCIFDLISRLGDFSMSSSLSPIFRLALAVFIPWRGLTDSTGARDGTRADGVLDRGRRRLLFFLAFCLAAPSSYRVDRGRHPGVVAIRWGGAASTILATHARARGAMRRFQIAVSFFRFSNATESMATRSDWPSRRAGGGARRRATPWPPKAARASRSLSVGAWLPRAAPDHARACGHGAADSYLV